MAPASLKEKYKNDYLPSDSLNKLFSIYIQNYQGGLESLSNNENLSSNFVHFYSYILQLKRWQAYLNRFFFNTKLTTDTTINNFFNDSFYPYPSYRNFANLYVTTYVSKHFNIPFIRESNGSYMDSRISFDTIASQEDIPTQTKVLLLRNCLSWIINNFSANDLKIYLDKYEAITGDTHTVQRLKQKHKLDFSTSNELMLQDGNEHPLSFQDLLEKHKNKAIVFVYLAFNDEEKAWKNAVKKFEVDCLSESYFITNSKTSQLIVDLEVKSIPRYLLYNKLGKLVHKKAPDAKEEEIRTLLNQYLAE
ncbi:MAG: hypothetical protein LBG19_07705 [Prevotellaceae bacterium]|jgi:hypothetical protein|nr:hypothetical protein [Prevotellaceae bacterium]